MAESRTWFMCWAQHLPRPRPQVPVLDENGWVFAYADFVWEEEGVFLEFDGRIKYEKYRRKGETLEEYLMREKRREEQICLLTGWQCIRIRGRTWSTPSGPRPGSGGSSSSDAARCLPEVLERVVRFTPEAAGRFLLVPRISGETATPYVTGRFS